MEKNVDPAQVEVVVGDFFQFVPATPFSFIFDYTYAGEQGWKLCGSLSSDAKMQIHGCPAY